MGGPAAGELTRSVYYITTTRRLSTSSITTLPRRRLSDLHQLAVIIQKQPPGRITVKGGGEPVADVRYFIFVLRRAILQNPTQPGGNNPTGCALPGALASLLVLLGFVCSSKTSSPAGDGPAYHEIWLGFHRQESNPP